MTSANTTTASTVLAWVVGLYMKPAQKEWNSKIENRLSATKGFLSNIKTIRMTGLTSILSDTIRNKLNIEVDASKNYRFYWSFIFAIGKIWKQRLGTLLF